MTDSNFKDLIKEALSEHDAAKRLNNEYLDMKQVCELLHIKRNAVYARIKNDKNKYGQKLPCHKAGGRVLFKKSDVLKFIK